MLRANLSRLKAGRIIPMIELHENTEFEQIYAEFKDKVTRYIWENTERTGCGGFDFGRVRQDF